MKKCILMQIPASNCFYYLGHHATESHMKSEDVICGSLLSGSLVLAMEWRERVYTSLINCEVELSLTFLFLQWKKRGLEGEEDSLEEISRGRKGRIWVRFLSWLCRKI